MWHSDRRQRLVQVPVWTNRQTPDQWGFVNVPSCKRSLEGLKGKGPLDGRQGSPDGLLGG